MNNTSCRAKKIIVTKENMRNKGIKVALKKESREMKNLISENKYR